MIARKYFEQIRELDKEIQEESEKLQELRLMTGSISAVSYQRDKCITTPCTDAIFVREFERIEKHANYLNELMSLMADLKEQAEKAIGTVVNDKQRTILVLRYIEFRSPEQIMKKMGICRRSVFKWIELALEAVTLPEDPIWFV